MMKDTAKRVAARYAAQGLSKADVADSWSDGLNIDLGEGWKHDVKIHHPDGGRRPTPYDVEVEGRGDDWTFSVRSKGSTFMPAGARSGLRSGDLEEWLPGGRDSPDLERHLKEVIEDDLSETSVDSFWYWEMEEELAIASDRALEDEVMQVTDARPKVSVEVRDDGIRIKAEAAVKGQVEYA